jgi:NADH:ubiquinone oxidoreductase subunit F (NADH-binding)/NADH:ubiquinone oxidoreductase subunit E
MSAPPEPNRAAAVLSAFPRERRWLLPALQALQRASGHLSDYALRITSAHLRVPASEVYGVATHYPELRLRPLGAHHVRVCTGVSCALGGGRELWAALERRFGPAAENDGSRVTIERADCFFACSVAPLIEVDGAYRGRVAIDDVGRIESWFSRESAGAAPAPDPRPGDGHRAAGERAGPISAAGVGGPLVGVASAQSALDGLVRAARERQAARPALRLLVGMGTCGRAVGADDVFAALRDGIARRGLTADIVEGACNGMCYAAPLVEIHRRGWPRLVVERLSGPTSGVLVEGLADDGASFAALGLTGIVWSETPWRGLAPVAEHPFWRGQERVLLRRAGALEPESLDDALVAGTYRALAQALDDSPDRVVEQVKASGLQGRGGAFFPAAIKWEACRQTRGEPKYLVMNGEEGEPGIFKDRHLMEGDPHQILEGALLAAYAAGATRLILYVHGEAELSARRLARAVADAETAGLVGARVLGRDVSCFVELRRGAGGFVLGEETALLESIEGRRAQPRTRPPFPVESGLWGRPTVINNVETLATVPSILADGADRFVALGTASASGPKVFGLSGPIRRPGVVETRNGVTLSALLNGLGGGLPESRAFLGALVGGPSGSVVPRALFDVPMEPRGRVSPGTGGIVAIPVGASIVSIVETLLAFNANESCGKCTPCREGAPRLLAMIDELRRSSRAAATRTEIGELAEAMQSASLCGLGQAAPLALLRALETFPAEFGLSDPAPVSPAQ